MPRPRPERAAQDTARAEAAAEAAQAAMIRAGEEAEAARALQAEAAATAESAESTLSDAETARAEVQSRETAARGARSEAEGEAGALRAEVAALARMVEREASAGSQLLDRLQVERGFEAALGAALADDLRAPEIDEAAASGWVTLPPYDAVQPLPEGAVPLAGHVTGPDALARRLTQIGVVDRAAGPALQTALHPGQRLVSREGDLWRWDGFRAAAEDLPSAAALRLQQLNRLVELKRDLEEAAARADGAGRAHEVLRARLAELSRAEQMARDARREADRRLIEAGRAQSRAEGERERAGATLEQARQALARHREEARPPPADAPKPRPRSPIWAIWTPPALASRPSAPMSSKPAAP
jgi:chromosome segregation protein